MLRHALALFLVLVSVSPEAQAEAVPDTKPSLELTGRVVDAADLLDDAAEERITAKLEEAERDYGPQLVVATTSSLGGRSIDEYTIDLARSWGIGDKVRNDGLVLLVAPVERKVRIEVGFGLEATFTDEFAAEVLDQDVLPAFRASQMARGIEAGVDRLIAKMKLAPTVPATEPANDNAAPAAKDDAA